MLPAATHEKKLMDRIEGLVKQVVHKIRDEMDMDKRNKLKNPQKAMRKEISPSREDIKAI